MSKKDFKYYKRGFLNKGEGKAFFEADICEGGYASAYFTIADCNRQITLEFSHYTKTEYKKNLDKLDLLISELEKFREKLKESREAFEAKENK